MGKWHSEYLRPLLEGDLTQNQRRAVLRALAEGGAPDAQAAVLEDMIERARADETVDGISWKRPVAEPSIVELLGDLILELPYVANASGVRFALDPRSAAEGARLPEDMTEAARLVIEAP